MHPPQHWVNSVSEVAVFSWKWMGANYSGNIIHLSMALVLHTSKMEAI